MNGFLTPDKPSNLILPQFKKIIADLNLPFTHKDNFRLIKEATKSDVNISKSSLYKLIKGENVGKNVNAKLRELYLEISNVYQPTPSNQALVSRSLKVRSNATDWLYFLDGLTQSRDDVAWRNTMGFLKKRCIDDIALFEELKSVSALHDRLSRYMAFLKGHTLIPEKLIESTEKTYGLKINSHNQSLGLSSTIDALLFNFHLRADFLFSLAASFERDLDIPHLDINQSYVPQSRVVKTIDYYIDQEISEKEGYRNLFGCFLKWIIENMPKPDGTNFTWSELASCVTMPDNSKSNESPEKYQSVETLQKRQYDELRKWRKATTNRHKPGNEKLAEFVACLFRMGDDNHDQADIVYLMLKFFMLLDDVILEWQDLINQVESENGYDNDIDGPTLIHSVLRHYHEHWLQVYFDE